MRTPLDGTSGFSTQLRLGDLEILKTVLFGNVKLGPESRSHYYFSS